jgi:hypothetical protein
MRTTTLLLLCACTAAACGDNRTHPGEPDPYQPGDAGVFSCLPNLDGRIDADELQTAIGVPLQLLVSPAGATRAVDLGGSVDGAGKRFWDWSAPASDDQSTEIAAHELVGAWFAGSFPTGQFTLQVDLAGRTQGIYRRDDAAISLLGLASTDEDPSEGKTLLVYDTPIPVTRFPVVDGDAWTATSTVVNGTIQGLPYAGRDTYEVHVDGAGKLLLPDLTFTQAFRVRTKVTVSPSVGQALTRRQVSFLFECFGEVARATSRDNETAEDFTTAAEIRRLAL